MHVFMAVFSFHQTKGRHTVKPLNFARDLISLILQVIKIREIKYPRKFKFYIDSNSKASRFAKLSTCKDGSNLQFAKLSPREIKVFYSNSGIPYTPYTFRVRIRIRVRIRVRVRVRVRIRVRD